MKFNKAKLAALATSVFMGIAMFAASAFAGEAVDGYPTRDHSAEPVTGYTVVQDSIQWFPSKDGSTCKVEYDIQNGEGETYHVTGAQAELWDEKTLPATCTEPMAAFYRVTLFGDVYASGELTIGDPLGHNWQEIKRVVLVAPTCEEAGDGYAVEKCARCGLEQTISIKDQLEAYGHDWGEEQIEYIPVENILVDEDGNVVLDEKGIPELDDITKDGKYQVRTYQVCKRDETHINEVDLSEEQIVLAKKGVKAYVTDEVNVAESNSLIGLQYSEFNEIPPFAEIELEDCTKDAKFEVTFFTAEDRPVSHEWITIPAHHMPMRIQIEFPDQYDYDDAIVTYNEDGTYSIYNKSCYRDITYFEVIHCSAAGCPNDACDEKYLVANGEEHDSEHEISRVQKTKSPDGDHIINTDVWKALEELEEPVDYDEIVETYGWTEDPLHNKKDSDPKATRHDTYVLISENTATCTENGEVTVQFVCKICKQVIKEMTLETEALGHIYQPAVGENVVEPTCTTQGHYDAVIYCKRCNEVLWKREAVKIPRLAHSNELGVHQDAKGNDESDGPDYEYDKTAAVEFVGDVVVDFNGNILKGEWINNSEEDLTYVGTKAGDQGYASYAEDYTVVGKVYTVCEYCGGHRVDLYDADLEVLDVQKSTKNGYPGSITIEATYVKDGEEATAQGTFDYYTSINEYQSRVEKAPEEPTPVQPQPEVPEQLPAVENLKAATAGMNKVTLTWDAVEGANGYLILKNGTQIAYTTGATTYTDKNASAENFEFYWVIPYQTVNGKNYKGELSNYVWGIGRVVGQVKSLTATAAEGTVELSWSAVSGANGYVVLSKTGSNTAPFNAPVEVEGTSCTVKAEAGKVQFYWVYATYTNADGNRVAAGKVSPFAWAIAE